jgi:hypothetical protein
LNLRNKICGTFWRICDSDEVLLRVCWWIKYVSTYDPQAYGPTSFSPQDSEGSFQSTKQGDYKHLIYIYSLATQTLTMIKLEND